MEFTHQTGDEYHVTGVTTDGKRFKRVCANPMIAMSINLYRGTVWQVRNGKRKRLKSVYN